jgi:outer membrane protein assembly factor BamE
MMRKILIPALLVCLTATHGCSVYRPTIQQGNILDADQISKLKPGMSKRQVVFVMGTPLLEDPFHKNRWDYIHTSKSGSSTKMTFQRLTLYFDKDTLERIDKSALQKKLIN